MHRFDLAAILGEKERDTGQCGGGGEEAAGA